ncbi:UNKNOWN [Stylonychia lemnae]|uniref:Uncharacterized protein n=1 Tax=Stylonychia lemnae TaxID=5949 RepID=A0A078ARE4_STYLE|nr:UNKNOWN [Stylonychia lemnae]|eukprot:CDW84789.1 UNKNOWN [Stylonychia lemnae]
MPKKSEEVELKSRDTGAKVKVQSDDLFAPQDKQDGEGTNKAAKKLPSKKRKSSSSEEEDSFENKYKNIKQQKQFRKKQQQDDEENQQNQPGNPDLEQDRPRRRQKRMDAEEEPLNQVETEPVRQRQSKQRQVYDENEDLYEDELYYEMTQKQTKIWQIEHYQPYFNLSTFELFVRLRKSLWPFCTKSHLFADEDVVDLYGPLWIMLTLIVEIAIVGFIDYQIDITTAAMDLKKGKINLAFVTYSLLKVAQAAFVCVAYFILNPLLLFLLIKYVLWVSDIQYIWLFAIYGYSFTIFIITTGLNVVPITWLKWVFLAVSGIVSLFFIVSEIQIQSDLNSRINVSWQLFMRLMTIDIILDKHDKKEMIKSLLKYNPNKPYDNKKIKQIEQDLKSKFLKKNQSEKAFSFMVTNDRNSLENPQHLKREQSQPEFNSIMIQKPKDNQVIYERLQNQYKDYVVGGSSNYQFYAQKRRNKNLELLSPLNNNYNSTGQLNGDSMPNVKIGIPPTEKAKRFIYDKSSLNKSTQRIGISLPSPVVYKNQFGLKNQSELKRYENVIGKLQQLALRLDLNKNNIDAQKPILRNFNQLHNINIPLLEDNQNEYEERIISYVEKRKFLEINDSIRQLKSVDDHFAYAITGEINRDQNKTVISAYNDESVMLSQTRNTSQLDKSNSKNKIVYNEGCGVALVNEKQGQFDATTIQYFETGISLTKVSQYMKVVADIKNYVLLEGNLMKIYKFTEDDHGKGKWIAINLQPGEDYIFDQKTLYAIGAYQNLTYN